MTSRGEEPTVRVGIISAPEIRVSLNGSFCSETGDEVEPGDYSFKRGDRIRLTPRDPGRASFTVHEMTFGHDFHWQRKESLTFQGGIEIQAGVDGVTLVNELSIESYLVSVISSEMSASSPPDLLRAHAVISRSWLLHQLAGEAKPGNGAGSPEGIVWEEEGSVGHLTRWYDREAHGSFDVCADDHCQRYQGLTRVFSEAAIEAVSQTRGEVLTYSGDVCDARYSKSCGGMTEVFESAWEDRSVPYLKSFHDGVEFPGEYSLPLTVEENAVRWMAGSPPAYCNVRSRALIERVLPKYDQETGDFYRWRVDYGQRELGEITCARLGVDLGSITKLEPVQRGPSGRIIRLRIVGTLRSVVLGKELEIRKTLSRSHLYSSAFIVIPGPLNSDGAPDAFGLIGAGWGHGVGLCQIGAAAMSDAGFGYREILSHYFRGARLTTLYG